MKKVADVNKKYLFIGGGLLFVFAVVLLFRRKESNNKEQKDIDVKVTIEDDNGNTTVYDPNPLLVRLNKGLITRYYFDFSERCEPIKELYNLDAARFMATVKAYKVKYNEDIQTHMKACNVDCNTGVGYDTYFDKIYQRIDALKDIIQ